MSGPGVSALDTTREEIAWRTFGAACARVRQAGDALTQAFEEYERRRDEMTEARLGEGQPHWEKTVESAYAAWKNQRTAGRPEPVGWPLRDEAVA